MSDRVELLLGCGNRRDKEMYTRGREQWEGLVTADIDRECGADIVVDLDRDRWDVWTEHTPRADAFSDNWADEVHAYHLLEHLGEQGDLPSFFGTFGEVWRILKPGGYLFAEVPALSSPWLWGDPGHRRVITRESLVFLDRGAYEQVGRTRMADYRGLWRGDLRQVDEAYLGDNYRFVLEAVKPARP